MKEIIAAVLGGAIGLAGVFLGTMQNKGSKLSDLKNDMLSNKLLSRIMLFNEYNSKMDDGKLFAIEYWNTDDFNKDYTEAQVYMMKLKNLEKKKSNITKAFRREIEIDHSSFVPINIPAYLAMKKIYPDNAESFFILVKQKHGKSYVHRYANKDYLIDLLKDLKVDDSREIEKYIDLIIRYFDGRETKSIQKYIEYLPEEEKIIMSGILEQMHPAEECESLYIHIFNESSILGKTFLYISAGKTRKIAKLID